MTSWRLRMAGRGDPAPVLVEGDPATSKGGFVESLAAVGYPLNYVYVDGERWSARETEVDIAASNLRNGSLISEDGTSSELERPGTYLVAVGGPASGEYRRLDYHEPVAVGRDPGPGGLSVDDGLLSSRHFEVELGEGDTVTAVDLGSKNGSVYENAELSESTFEQGCLLHAGASLFAIVHVGADDRATLRGETPNGLNIHRRFREARPSQGAPPEAPSPPREGNGSIGSPWWRALMPLVTAIGFAVMFGRWQFLLIAAFAPIVYAIDNQRRKKSRKHDVAQSRADYELAVARFETKMAEHLADEARRARSERSGGGRSALYAGFRHSSVWERRPQDDDFLSVTLGYADLPTSAPSRDDARASRERTLWKSPLSISLTEEGPLGITGPVDRASAVARSLLVELVFAHAPVDVALWVFTDESRADAWSFVQWLPHAFTDDGGARLAATATARMGMMQALRGQIEARRELDQKDRILPVHVVVVDGVDNVSAPDLTELLRSGPAVGVHGIVTDPTVISEGIRAEVKLGRYDDECSYRSEMMAKVDDVTVSQVSAATAERAALSLAPLEAFRQGSSARPVGTVFFTELIGYGERTPEEQAAAWRRHSPRTAVPVGVTMDGQIIDIDIVKHGPHGLVGGMTRSGKTEFLKTLFSSLAIHNHPDDLAIAIIDFKGGVDHRQTARFPHVVALATNQNIDRFERTITLLTAEQQRRQLLFDEAECSTIEGYRSARETRPELPPLPRLLVVVDEFVELLETAEGKAQIGKLESIARIGAGLGTHLLLVTQNFSSSLPPQIDGQAGLRVCFKVGNAGDSKTVLGTSAAAGIASSDKGRAFVRFQGGDVLEFQSARIGNKSRETTDDGDLTAHHVTIESLTAPPVAPQMKEVPDVEQDLYRVVETARRAARLDRGANGTVPWPAELPADLDLDGVRAFRFESGSGPTNGSVIGVADHPERQRVTPVRLDVDHAVTVAAGANGSGHHETLMTMATAAALETSPDDLHVYGIDLVGQGLAQLAPLPHVGTIATRDDQTALRILNWLVAESASRRAVIARSGASDYDTFRDLGDGDLPRILLLVLGADRMFLHGEGQASPLLAPMTTVVNEIAGTGIQVVFTGNAATVQNRLGTTATRRLIFRANDPSDYPATVPRALRGQLDATMRCVDSATGSLSQIARVCPHDVNAGDVYRALGEGLEARFPGSATPRRFSTAPWPLMLSDLTHGQLTPPPAMTTPLPLGVRPESGEVLWLDPVEDGNAFRIIGGPKSGRSNAAGAVAVLADRCGWRVLLAAASRRSPLASNDRFARWRIEPDTIMEHLASPLTGPTLLVIDDAHRLDLDWEKIASIDDGPLVTVVAGSTDALTKSTGIMRSLGAPDGVALMPGRTRDAGGVGVAVIDDEWVVNPLAGIGAAGIASEAHRIQFPLVVDA